jgi:hypothetical protein
MLFRIILYFHFRFAAPARQRSGNELCLRSANHKPCVSRARLSEWRIMLRFKIPASTFPLILAGVFAGSGPFPAKWPCITLGETSVQIAPSPWQAQLNVSFTSDPATATVRVQIVDGAEAADFAHVDDVGSTEANACEVTAATRFVGIAEAPSAAGPVIYLSQDGNAGHRLFVQSKRFTPREAAALLVGASGGHGRMAAAAL